LTYPALELPLRGLRDSAVLEGSKERGSQGYRVKGDFRPRENGKGIKSEKGNLVSQKDNRESLEGTQEKQKKSFGEEGHEM